MQSYDFYHENSETVFMKISQNDHGSPATTYASLFTQPITEKVVNQLMLQQNHDLRLLSRPDKITTLLTVQEYITATERKVTAAANQRV